MLCHTWVSNLQYSESMGRATTLVGDLLDDLLDDLLTHCAGIRRTKTFPVIKLVTCDLTDK